MLTVSFCTLGCKVNQTESRNLQYQFLALGYQLVSFTRAADIIVINTCSVTHIAERKSRNYIRRALKLNPGARVYVCGCYANLNQDELKKIIPEIGNVIIQKDKLNLAAWDLPSFEKKQTPACRPEINNSDRVRQPLQIQDGCSQFCSYCIIPYARGQAHSFPLEQILTEAKDLLTNGAVELILTGINTGTYNYQGYDLVDLLTELEKMPELKRIRLSSLEPQLVSVRLLDKIASSPKLAHHLHIPLQSGSDRILKLMRRPYQLHQYRELLERIRERIPEAGITTDIIVGFPGETLETFQETKVNLAELEFADLHVFSYSPRNGTEAAGLVQLLTPIQVHKGVQQLGKLQKKMQESFRLKFVNQVPEIIVQEIKQGWGYGLSSEYILYKVKNRAYRLGELVRLTPDLAAVPVL